MVMQELINKWKQREPARKRPGPLMMIDDDRRIMWMNPAAENLVAKRNDELAGRAFCYEVFQCQDECGRALGAQCPGLRGFEEHQRDTRAKYIVLDEEGKRTKVNAKYRFVNEPIDGHRICIVQMKGAADTALARKQREMKMILAAVIALSGLAPAVWLIRRRLAAKR